MEEEIVCNFLFLTDASSRLPEREKSLEVDEASVRLGHKFPNTCPIKLLFGRYSQELVSGYLWNNSMDRLFDHMLVPQVKPGT